MALLSTLCFLFQAVSKPLGVYLDLLWQCILSYLTALLSTSLLSAPSSTLLLYQALAQLKRFISRKSKMVISGLSVACGGYYVHVYP